MFHDQPYLSAYDKPLSLIKNSANENLIDASENDSPPAGLAAPHIGVIDSSPLAYQAASASEFIYSQYKNTLQRDHSEKPLQLVLITGKADSDPNRSPLLDSFINDAPQDTFIVKNQPATPADPQTAQKTHLPYRPSPADSHSNIVITARSFAVDRLNRIIGTDREDIATIDEELISKQAKIAPASYLKSLRALKRRLRD